MKNEKVILQIRIPAKLILFGEWAVLEGYSALGCSVGKYFECILQDHKNQALEIQSPEATYTWNQGTCPKFLEKTQELLEFLFDNPADSFAGKKLTLTRHWDLSEGLGSSSALFLSLALLKSSGFVDGSTAPLKHAAADFYRKKLVEFQKSGSGFDILLQCLGGFHSVRIAQDSAGEKSVTQSLDLNVPEEIIFIHTGRKMKTEMALQDFRQRPTYKDAVSQIGRSSEEFLVNKDWLKAIQHHHSALKQMGVVPTFVLDLENEWKSKQWIKGIKTTGAGGGDTLMLFINACHRQDLEEDLKKRYFWLEEAPLGVPGALS